MFHLISIDYKRVFCYLGFTRRIIDNSRFCAAILSDTSTRPPVLPCRLEATTGVIVRSSIQMTCSHHLLKESNGGRDLHVDGESQRGALNIRRSAPWFLTKDSQT
jgi:hypothetical protein